MENPIKMDDLGFGGTTIFGNIQLCLAIENITDIFVLVAIVCCN